jgi:hypothetical protein
MVIKYNDVRIKKKVTSNGERRIMMRLGREEKNEKIVNEKRMMDSRIKKEYNERNKIEKKEGKEGTKEPK